MLQKKLAVLEGGGGGSTDALLAQMTALRVRLDFAWHWPGKKGAAAGRGRARADGRGGGAARVLVQICRAFGLRRSHHQEGCDRAWGWGSHKKRA